jgi:hypothetical protein
MVFDLVWWILIPYCFSSLYLFTHFYFFVLKKIQNTALG